MKRNYYKDMKRRLALDPRFINGYSRTLKEINDFSKHIKMEDKQIKNEKKKLKRKKNTGSDQNNME